MGNACFGQLAEAGVIDEGSDQAGPQTLGDTMWP